MRSRWIIQALSNYSGDWYPLDGMEFDTHQEGWEMLKELMELSPNGKFKLVYRG